MNMKIVLEPFRNSQETTTKNMKILSNVQYWLKFLVSFRKNVYLI